MKKGFFVVLFLVSCVNAFSQKMSFTTCKNCWNPDSLGNHRVALGFAGSGKYAKAIIPWRRRDRNPQDKRIIIQDAKTKQKILNIKTGILNRESGEIYFEPVSGAGIYYVYYMPYKNEGNSNYPKGIYLIPDTTASQEWLSGLNTGSPLAVVKEIQSIDSFNTFYPMEIIATKKETEQLLEKNRYASYLIFPEDREHSIRMVNDLPQRWIANGPKNYFNSTASKGENFAFQLGVYALQNLENVKINFTDLTKSKGEKILSKNIFCINTGGVGYDGSPFKKELNIDQYKVQALWCGIDVPLAARAGIYKGKAIVSVDGRSTAEVRITLTVSNHVEKNYGVNEPWKMTRLRWLNSRIAQKNTVIAPYTPLVIKNNTIRLLGRKLEINNDGFPKQIQTFFNTEMTGYKNEPNNLLTEPIHFYFTKLSDRKNMILKSSGVEFLKREPGTVEWKSTSSNDTLEMEVFASMEFDGFLSYRVKLTALQDINLKDIAMHIPFEKNKVKYMMGLGQKGGYRPENIDWKWDVAHMNQDGAWIGNVNAGLQYSLRDEKYARPLNTNFYLQKPLLLPLSWGNKNEGGITIAEKGKSILANNYSGERRMTKGDVLYYNFNLLITPFHPINTNFQWSTRFFHAYRPIDTIKATGATVINIHHATAINPYINYPFIEWKAMKAYVDSAHAVGLKVKIYNTIRELSDHAYEIFALRSLGHEIYSGGKGRGFSWLQEHLDSDYIPAWFVPELKDAAIINSGTNRWHNYYVEGMDWLTKNVGIDGIYLDDVAFDRVTMKRIKRVLTNDGHPGIIDLHSANQFNKNDGFNNSANLYMEHFPYLNRLWFGEYFDYEKNNPDFFLTEVSGIPFGLMGEMLQGGGNPWRGMIYGMTNRMPWSDNADPRPIWKVWDDFGMLGTKMIGYWVDDNPVKTDNEKVMATIFKKKGKVLIAIASWANEDAHVQLKIDWKKLGIDSLKATITAPEVKNFQFKKSFKINEKIPVGKGKGWLLILQ